MSLMRKEIINMTQKEINRFRVITQTIDSVLTIKEAAEVLGLSERQVIRLKGGVLKEGPAFIIHKNRGRKPQHAVLDETKKKLAELKQSKYAEANFTHFKELLEEHEGIHVSYSTVYRALTENGIKSPKKHRKRKSHHRRKRKPQKGLLVQIDASPHEWIIGGEVFNLHGAIDDATGEVLALFFAPAECVDGYFEIMRQIINKHGVPISIYTDNHTIFKSPKEDKLSIEEQLRGEKANLTQFKRAMQELGINMIYAKTCRAKGRIERLWETLQSRLPVEFKIRGINTLDAANAFLAQYMICYNKKFAVEPENPQPAFVPLKPGINLDYILCKKEKRTVIEGSAFSYKGTYYQLMKNDKKATTIPKATLTVLDSPIIGIKAIYSDVVYDTVPLQERPKRCASKSGKQQPEKQTSAPVKPAADHPWRQAQKTRPYALYEETDREILEMVRELFDSTRAWA